MEIVQRRPSRTVEFGIYRDGDNNLDDSQSVLLDQARVVSTRNRDVQFTVEDTTHDGFGKVASSQWTIQDGTDSVVRNDIRADDMASPQNLARFVARTLDNAQKSDAKQTWIELVDHGAGDGGGLEADSFKQLMPMPAIAQAIADGVKLHAQEHPEDAGRKVDGVVANQCLMASLGFADSLSHAGVKYLAASPETMVSPGVPSNVADAIAKNADDPQAMGKALVTDVMQQRYGVGNFGWRPAAAFDMLDLDPQKRENVENKVKALNDLIAARVNNKDEISALRQDATATRGMVRFHDATPDMPWHADRPAIALYDRFANDTRLDMQLRDAAKAAEDSVRSLVIAHAESSAFAPFGNADYRDAAGPTVHFPINAKQIDPWAPRVTETHNRFFDETDAAGAERVIA
ncbi:MAG TPA: hypothetical protein VGR69_02550 [Candidatus Rubrimentiphilum sp.]|nr:hypothetical protein [Candidatus Rubrimentiphilum sp.]